MSKINKIRFVNLNYNNNSIKIDDECFFLDGENTLLNLRNGGGKSVIVQMVMALFVNRRHRNTPDRAFESYFTLTSPTYLMVEWQLDDGAGYALTGMMVRKKDASSDEDSKEKLDIVNFVHEYTYKNEFDIDNLPIIEMKENSKIIKSFASSKKLFEDLKKNRELRFNWYDMNNSITTKNYFNKLEECKINYKEWETIIKQINRKESGLSELFTKSKDTAGLVKEWFLPTIEDKLKKDEDRIKNYRELLDKYIKQYRANKDKIDKKERIELFDNLSEDIIQCCKEFISTIDTREEKENEIANVMISLRKAMVVNDSEEEKILLLIEQLKEKIFNLNYESASIEIYQKEDDIDGNESALKEKKYLRDESEKVVNGLKAHIDVVQCAKLHRVYQAASEELQKSEIELNVFKAKEEDSAPRINDLGYSIKRILKAELNQVEMEKQQKEELKKTLALEAEEVEKTLEVLDKKKGSLLNSKGQFSNAVEGFQKIEDRFNKKYEIGLVRNIEGIIDNLKLLSVENEISTKSDDCLKKIATISEKLHESKEQRNSKISDITQNTIRITEINSKLTSDKQILHTYDEEIEKRIEIIKYVDFDKNKVFKKEEIIEAFDRVIYQLRHDMDLEKKSLEQVKKEAEQLKTGRNIELPKNVEKKLRDKEINFIYGMEWLKKNGKPLEQNEKLVKDNPFIPYSLIMETSEVLGLEQDSLELFTSTPISIISREDLEQLTFEGAGNLLNFKGIRFYLSFNNKLLNEKELMKIIEEKEGRITNLEKGIKALEERINFYEEKRDTIKYSKLTLKVYEDIIASIEVMEKEAMDLRDKELKLNKEVALLEEKIKKCEEDRAEVEMLQRKNHALAEEFQQFKEEYQVYKSNKNHLEEVIHSLNIIEVEIRGSKKNSKELQENIKQCGESIWNYVSSLKELNKQFSAVKDYSTGNMIDRDKEDLLAEYEALRKEISSTEEELRANIEKCNKKFKDAEEELNVKAEKLNVKEIQYVNETYALEKELELNQRYQDESSKLMKLKDKCIELEMIIVAEKTRLEGLLKDLKKNFHKEEPIERQFLYPKDYKLEIAKETFEVKVQEDNRKAINKRQEILKNIETSLKEYDFEVSQAMEIAINYDTLSDEVGILRRDLRNLRDREGKHSTELTKAVMTIENRKEFKQEALFTDSINTLKQLVNTPREFYKQINMVLEAYNKLIQALLVDIAIIEREEGKILESLLEYIKEIHENLEKIDDNSTIEISGKRRKMLEIFVEDWNENQDRYIIRLKDYIEALRNEGLKELEKNEAIEGIIDKKVNTYKLYDEIVGISNVRIKLYKVEANRQRQITWDEVAKNSGGEGFLSAFVILSSLLSYIRKEDNDLFSRKEGGKVLIMDNPFAQTSSIHLLKPLMEVAKKSNTQLICLTALNGDAIYNRFDNIYVLNLISSKLKSGVQYLKGTHEKGKEDSQIVVASRFKIEDQLRLF